MAKLEKKTFTVLQRHQEENYIEEMTEKGFKLKEIREDGHYFEEVYPFKSTCIMEYFSHHLPEDKYYEDLGLELISSFKGSKGYWNYYLGPYVPNIIRREDSYKDLLDKVGSRNEIFWNLIPMSLSLFGIFMFYNTKNPVFFVLILLPLVIYFMIRNVKKDINKQKGGED